MKQKKSYIAKSKLFSFLPIILALSGTSLIATTNNKGACCKKEIHANKVTTNELEVNGTAQVNGDLDIRGCITGCLDFTPKTYRRVIDPTRGRSVAYSTDNMAAASTTLAAMAALDVLKNGGNAVDAAVAMGGVYSITEPHNTGIGGDSMFIIWSAKDKKLHSIRGQGRSPATLTREALVERGFAGMPLFGPEPIMVPGAVGGWATAIELFGSGAMTLAELLEPAVQYAENGILVTEVSQGDWAYSLNPNEPFSQVGPRGYSDPNFIAAYTVDGVNPPAVGQLFKFPDYANSLRLIQQQGPGVLYGGELGKTIADYVQSQGGFLTLEDLANYETRVEELNFIDFKGYRIYEQTPPGQGLIVLEALGILEGFDLLKMGHNSVDYIHTLLEAVKLGFADNNAFVADPAFMTVSIPEFLTPEYLAERRSLIDPTRAKMFPPGNPNATKSFSFDSEVGNVTFSFGETGDTVNGCVTDKEGNMVSYIASQFFLFGSGLLAPGTGFTLNDRGFGFSFDPNNPNVVGPNKIPRMTNIPAFVTKFNDQGEEEPVMAFGCMGANMQPQGHVQFLLNHLVFGKDLQVSADDSRFFFQQGFEYSVEPFVSECVKSGLAGRGHQFITPESVFGNVEFLFGRVQAIEQVENGYAASSDRRADGVAVGQ